MQEMFDNASKAGKLLKVISHPHRLMILCALLEGKKNVTELTEVIGISQTAMSNHLARLRSEGIVDFVRYHRSLVYELISPDIARIINTLYQIYCAPEETKPAKRAGR